MDIGIISKRYAKALYEYACENKNGKAVYKEMQMLINSYQEGGNLRSALENPVLSKAEKIRLLCEAAGGNVSNEYKRFATLVFEERREKFMPFIAYSYIDLYRKLNNINIGKLITASPVKNEIIERMKNMVAKKTQGRVEFETQVESSIMGGFIFEINFNRLDASIATQINKVRQQFIEKNRRIV